MWDEKISEGPMWGPQSPGRARRCWGTQVGCAHLVHPPLVIFAPKNLKYLGKNHINFSEHFENFYFWVIFLLHGEFRKQTKHGILFYLTNKNRKQKVGT